MQFDLEPQEAAFVVNVLGKLPTESGAFPLHQKLAAQFNAQAQPQPAAAPAGEEAPATVQ